MPGEAEACDVVVHGDDALARPRERNRVPADSAERVQDHVGAAPVGDVLGDLGRRHAKPPCVVQQEREAGVGGEERMALEEICCQLNARN